jgi:Asp-tRNA(Asn)/Glu-tRNA(Gln) amidotransferase A subunit family amidase
MQDEDMCYLSIAAAARLVAARELSPVALTEAVFRRIAETDGRVHSYVRLMRSSAIEEARRSEERLAAGEGRGPLEGVPIAVKDLLRRRSTCRGHSQRPEGR